MTDQARLAELRTSLQADGYDLAVTESVDGGYAVDILAGPDACADCLAPEPLMRSILQSALEVPEEQIALTYPKDHGAGGD